MSEANKARGSATVSAGKHTPGPWAIKHGTNIASAEGFGVAACGGYFNSKIDPEILTKTHEANARLIAAAPDMLEALDAIVVSEAFRHLPDREWRMAQAAIAKAKGGGDGQ